MQRRYISIWFRHLLTDWTAKQKPDMKDRAFVLCAQERGATIIMAANALAEQAGASRGMTLADARAIAPDLLSVDFEPGRAQKILSAMADWCQRFSPLCGLQLPDGIWIDMTGGAHLFGGERKLLRDIVLSFQSFGYETRAALADTPGGAWAIARFGRKQPIIPPGELRAALAELPPPALRISQETAVSLRSLGIRTVADLYRIPRASLSRRFGAEIMLRMGQALGDFEEPLTSQMPAPEYAARLHFAEGLSTPEAIAKVLQRLMDDLCAQMNVKGCGLREGILQAFRLDGRAERLQIGTGSPSRNPKHLFKLFEEKLGFLDPGPGIETFILSAPKTEQFVSAQNGMGMDADNYFHDDNLPELIDRLAGRLGAKSIYGVAPRDSHWPERALKPVGPLEARPAENWPLDKERPVMLLARPEPIDVMAPVPDDPPLLFRRKGVLHRIRRSEGPERIEAEWWLRAGELRDYYRLEDETGNRYWVFRAGHYKPEQKSEWFLHGFFG